MTVDTNATSDRRNVRRAIHGRGRLGLVGLAVLTLFSTAAPAVAQTAEPNLSVGAPPSAPPPEVEWKAQAKGGLLWTGGNSQTTNGTFGLTASRKQNDNKLSFDGMIAYGRSNVLVPVLAPVDPAVMPALPPTITALERRTVTTTNTWLAKARYDRFFTPNNSGYVSALSGADRIAGKAFAGGGQAGYSRQLLKNDVHLLVAEIGYDFSYERYVQQPMRTLEPVTIHSARALVGETVRISGETGATLTVEALTNLNKETNALNVKTGTPGVDPLNDTRVTAKLGLTTTIRKRLSVGLGFTLRYDQNPAPRPIPPGSASGAVYAATFRPFADKTDFLGEANLVYTLF